MTTTRALSLVAASLVGLSLGVAAGGTAGVHSAAGAPRTLVSLAAPIASFAQDGGRLAWMTGSCRSYWSASKELVDTVAVRAAAAGPIHVLAHVCGYRDGDARTGLVLSGDRVLYWWPVEGGNFTYHRFAIATLAGGSVPNLGVFGVMSQSYLSGAGGEGGPFVQATADFDPVNGCYGDPVPCVYGSTGRVSRVHGSTLVPVAGAPAPAALDASGALVAVAPAATRWDDNAPHGSDSRIPAAVNGVVQVRDIRTGELRGAFAPRGRVLDLALAGDVAAVLVTTGESTRVERYLAGSGRRTASTEVATTARDVGVAGASVIYRVGNAVYLFDGGRPTLVARASAPPIGLSITGRRVAWAENVGGQGRIRAVTLP